MGALQCPSRPRLVPSVISEAGSATTAWFGLARHGPRRAAAETSRQQSAPAVHAIDRPAPPREGMPDAVRWRSLTPPRPPCTWLYHPAMRCYVTSRCVASPSRVASEAPKPPRPTSGRTVPAWAVGPVGLALVGPAPSLQRARPGCRGAGSITSRQRGSVRRPREGAGLGHVRPSCCCCRLGLLGLLH